MTNEQPIVLSHFALHPLAGHTDVVQSVAWSPEGHLLASGSDDKTVRLWHGQTGVLLHTLQGHTDTVHSVAWSPDGQILVSHSDTTMRLWRSPMWETLQVVENVTATHSRNSLYFFSHVPRLATLDEDDIALHIWHVDMTAVLSMQPLAPAVHYTTAKIALVGDSSVGKSGLGYRIAESHFHVTESTHGQQFWIVDKLGGTHPDGLQCEVVLWDFAGQPNFRPIHALFLDDIDLALVLFDPSRPDTLAGVDYWLKQLMHKQQSRCRTILVAARIDVSQLSFSPTELEDFCRARGISGGFIAISAKTNQGMEALLERVRQQIDWNAKPTTITTETFKRVKDYVLLKAQANEKGLGSLEEARALHNGYRFQEVEALGEDERSTLLNATVELFLSRTICFREAVDGQTFLIFPSLILERPPRLAENVEVVEDLTYVVTGQVENVYAALVVLLGYSPSFQRTNQWRKQAQYETVRGEICGFKLANDEPGELELVLYYGKAIPDFVRSRFQGLFEEILLTRNVTVKKYAPVVCPKCQRKQERRTVIRRIEEGKPFTYCDEDGMKIRLNHAEHLVMSSESRALLEHDQALIKLRTSYETALSSIKKVVQKRKSTPPTCFMSYAWGDDLQKRWVLTLADDLRKADLAVVIDQWDNAAIGASIPRFISRIEICDFILAIGTPAYRQKYENTVSPQGSVVAAEVDLMNRRLIGTELQKASILPLLLNGEEQTSFPPLLHGRVYANFKHEEFYFVTLFDLLLTLYSIPFDDALVRDLRENLRKNAEKLSAK